jgi:hypothetical protein
MPATSVGHVQLRHSGPVNAGDSKEVVTHRTVRRRGYQNHFVSDVDSELPRHLGADQDAVGAGRGDVSACQTREKPADFWLEGRINTHEHSRRGRLPRAHETARVDAGRGRCDGGIGGHLTNQIRNVRAIPATDGLVEAALRPVVEGVNLNLAAQ